MTIAPHDKFVSITYFVTEMLGRKTRDWYYDHVDDPGMPKRIRVGDRTMLLFSDCVAYMDLLKAKPAAPVRRRRKARARRKTEAAHP